MSNTSSSGELELPPGFASNREFEEASWLLTLKTASGTATPEEEATFLEYLKKYDCVFPSTVATCQEYLTNPSAWKRAHGSKMTPEMLDVLERAKASGPNSSPAQHKERHRRARRPGRDQGRAQPQVPRDHTRAAMLSPVAASQRVEFAEIALIFDLLSPAHPLTQFAASVVERLAIRARSVLTGASQNASNFRSALVKLGFDIDLIVLASFQKPCFSPRHGERRFHLMCQIEEANEETRRRLLLLAAPDRQEALAVGQDSEEESLSFSRSLSVYADFLRQQNRQSVERFSNRMPAEHPRLLSDVASYGRAGKTPQENTALIQNIRQAITTSKRDLSFLLDLFGPRTVISWARQQLVTRQRTLEASLPRRQTLHSVQNDVIGRIAAGRPNREDDFNFYALIRASPAFHQLVRDRLQHYSMVEPHKFTLLRDVCEGLDPLDVIMSQPRSAVMELRTYIRHLEFQEDAFKRECVRQLDLPSSRYPPAPSPRQASAGAQTGTNRRRP